MLHCRWCGEAFEHTDELDWNAQKNAFWCDECDGLTFLNDEDDQRRMLLFLETGGAMSEPPAVKTKLRKRLSPLRYPGGKSRIIDQIYSVLSDKHLDTFVEVFAGGASLGLSLLDAGVVKNLVLNDLDPLLYAFWTSVLYEPGYLLSRLESGLPTRDDFYYAKKVLNGDTPLSELPSDCLAWSFFLLNRTCFSGVLSSGPMGGKTGTDEQLRVRWNPEKLKDRILRIHELSPHIRLENKDAKALLEEDVWWTEKTTLFIDPPYVVQGDRLYHSSFTEGDHKDLADVLNALYMSCPDPDIIISYDDCELVRSIYPYATQIPLPRCYSVSNKK